MAKKIKWQALQFSTIGISNAVVDISLLNILLWIWPTTDSQFLLIFNTFAYTCAIINSYIWNTKYTFSHRAYFNKKELGWFIIQAFIALLINNGTFIGLMDIFAVQTVINIPSFLARNIAKGMAMFLSSTASFFLMRYLVFKKEEESDAH
ncbi:GtrA family protein [Paraliobacillus sediminis]|uniref:GtrA family protein n=1 Tax=Paraliobacillus sediminis TaxID=1885916 RepID=UPI000E3C9F84|nr:GtrA family protein [Paraliobacillus sediminis]